MADVALRITGDSSNASAAIQSVLDRSVQAQLRATQITAQLEQSDQARTAARLQRALAVGDAEVKAADRVVAAEEKKFKSLERAAQTANLRAKQLNQETTRSIEDEAKKQTAAVASEAKKQGDARMGVAKQAAGAFIGGIGGGPVGAAVGAVIGGANPFVIAAASAATAIRSINDAYIDAAKGARDLQSVSGGTIEQTSLLIAVSQKYMVTEEQLAAAMRTVATQAVDNPKAFAAMGIALTDSEGKARPLIDVFNDVRRVLSESRNDFDRVTVATALMGRGATDMMPMLVAAQGEFDRFGRAAKDAGEVMDENLVRKERQWELTLSQFGEAWKNLAVTIAKSVVPMILEAMGKLADAFGKTASLSDLTRDPNGPYQQALAAEQAEFKTDITLQRGESMPAYQARIEEHDRRMAELQAAKKKALQDAMKQAGVDAALQAKERRLRDNPSVDPNAEFRNPLLGPRPAPSLADVAAILHPEPKGPKGPEPRDTVSDALRQQIEVIREASDKERQRAQDALDADQKRATKSLDLAEVLRKSTASVYDAEIKGIQKAETVAEKASAKKIQLLGDELDARQRLRDANVAALTAEQQAADDAFNARQTQRDADTQALQDQLADIGKVDQAAAAAAALAAAQKAVADEQAKDMTRVRSESLTDYQKRVADHNAALAKLEADLADVQTKQAEDVARETLQAKIDGISRAGNADKADAAVSKRRIDDRIAEIRKVADTDRTATNDQIENARRLRQTEKDTTDAQIEGLREEAASRDGLFVRAIAQGKAEQQAAKEKADALIAESRRATDAIIADLQKLAAARQPGAGAGSAWNSGVTIPHPVTGGQVWSGEYALAKQCEADGQHQWNWEDHTCFLKPTAAVGGGGAGGGGGASAAARTYGPQTAFHGRLEYDVPGFAGGGGLVLPTDAAIVGMGGKVLATADANEEIAFSGIGKRFSPKSGGGGGGDIVVHLHNYMDGREVAKIVSRHQGANAALHGYARRR